MASLILRPNLEFLPLPYKLEKARMTGLVLSGSAAKLQTLVAPLNTVAGSTRFKIVTAFGSRFVLAFMHYPKVRSTAASNPWGYFKYNEFAIYIPMLDTATSPATPCWYTPFMTVDSFLPLLAGREIFGFPKVTGKFSMGVLDDAGSAWKTNASWDMSTSTQVFTMTGANVEAAVKEIASMHIAAALPWLPNPFPTTIAAFLGGLISPVPGAPWDLLLNLLTGNPGYFIKQIPFAGNVSQASYQKLIRCNLAPTALYGFRFLVNKPGDITSATLQSPASYPLAASLGATTVENSQLGFAAEMDWTLPAGVIA